MKNAKAIVLVLCAILLFSACSSSSEETQQELPLRTYKEAYDKGYEQAVSQIAENIDEYLNCVIEDAQAYAGNSYDEVCYEVMPYLYGEDYGEYSEEELKKSVEVLLKFYEYYYDLGNHTLDFYDWHNGRFDKDYY